MSFAVLFALGAAVSFGLTDYVSGVLSRRLRILDILGIGNLFGLLLVIALLPLLPAEALAPADLVWGLVGGICSAMGVLLLLRGFRVGRFGVVSPVSSVGAAGIPVLAGLALGEQPSLVVLAGLVAGIASIWLVSGTTPRSQKGHAGSTAGLWEGLGAGVMLAAMYLTLSRADYASGPWPVVGMQVGVLAVIGLAMLGLRQRPSIPRADIVGVAVVGITAVLGALGFIYAARQGLVSIAAVLASMSPAITILLARMLIAERFTPRQIVGLGIAAAAILLISLG